MAGRSGINFVRFFFYKEFYMNEQLQQKAVALAYATARDLKLFPKKILIRADLHDTRHLGKGRYGRDPKGYHLTLSLEDRVQEEDGSHVASHGYTAGKGDYVLAKATHARPKRDDTPQGNPKAGKLVWPDQSLLTEYEGSPIAYCHLPEDHGHPSPNHAKSPVQPQVPLTRNSSNQGMSTNEDDEFQVQQTSPHLKSESKVSDNALGKAGLGDDESTASEDEGDPPHRTSSSPIKASGNAPARLGAIGSSRSRPPPKASVSNADDSETASDPDSPPISPAKSPQRQAKDLELRSEIPERAVGSNRVGLGKIGFAKSSATNKSPPTGEASDALQQRSIPARSRGQLGAIGPKRAGNVQESRGRDASCPEQTEQPRETSRERAIRRREELKRELEQKQASGPAKRNRRF